MKKTTRMLLMADRSEPRYNDGRRHDKMPRSGYPEWMPWYGEEPDMRGRERMPKRWDEPHQGYMGFGERDDEPESRGRRRTRSGRYAKATMGGHDDDDDWDEDEFEEQKGRGRVMSMPRKLDEHTAREWMEGLQNEDGSKGPHWTMEQTKQFAKQKGVQHDDLSWYVAMNIMYSDYYAVAKKFNVNNMDFYIGLAQAFLDDKDAAEGKLYSYYKHIVK